MDPISKITSKTVVLASENIDTDQIIPARFLKTTTRQGLGEHLFQDWRYHADGSPKEDFVLNQPQAKGARILVAGDNFGCGSSREHAPWALVDFGFQAVVSTSVADIFKNNSLKNGLVPVVVPEKLHQELLAKPGLELVVDIERQVLGLPDGREVEFPLAPFARHCLLQGVDELGFLLSKQDEIEAFEAQGAGE